MYFLKTHHTEYEESFVQKYAKGVRETDDEQGTRQITGQDVVSIRSVLFCEVSVKQSLFVLTTLKYNNNLENILSLFKTFPQNH